MKLIPLHDYVLVKRLSKEEASPGGIIIPDAAREKASRGEVLAVGPGAWSESGRRIEPSVKKGDIVLLPKYGGQDVPKDEQTILVHESELLAIEAQE